MKIYYYIPRINHYGPVGFMGSMNRQKIEAMSRRDSNGKVYDCDISDFKGHLMGNHWHG